MLCIKSWASLVAQQWRICLPIKAGDAGSIPGPGRSPREGNGNPLQYSCLVNPMDRGAWRDMGSQKSQIWLSNWTTATIKSYPDYWIFISNVMVYIVWNPFMETIYLKTITEFRYSLHRIFVHFILPPKILSIPGKFSLGRMARSK